MSDCIIWTKALSAAGYGVRNIGGVVHYAHRLAYVETYGPVPEGLELDHLCRNRACYNPEHLEAVTHTENMRRGHFGRKTHCPKGHPYDEVNTQINSVNGGRECRTCIKARKDARRTHSPRPKNECWRGHARTPENRLSGGGCKPCHRIASAAYKARKKGQVA